MMEVFLEAVGLTAPGMPGWSQSQDILQGRANWEPAPLARYKPHRLARNEARRATSLVRLAFQVCEDLASATERDLSTCSTVFASSGGDYGVTDNICRALQDSYEDVSPTQFHNSVHNAAAGYWSIATGSHRPSASIAAYNDTFQAGLIEATSFCCYEQAPVLLASYDMSPPQPILDKRNIEYPFAVALLLSPAPVGAMKTRFQMTLSGQGNPSTAVRNPSLEPLRRANPVAGSLALLELLAREEEGRVIFSGQDIPDLAIDVASL